MRRFILLTTLVCSVGSSGVSSAAGQWRYMNATAAEAAKTSFTAPAPEVPVIPANFMTMTGVSILYGEPERQAPAVGQPPITRWYYPGYTVYFERDRVITSVLD